MRCRLIALGGALVCFKTALASADALVASANTLPDTDLGSSSPLDPPSTDSEILLPAPPPARHHEIIPAPLVEFLVEMSANNSAGREHAQAELRRRQGVGGGQIAPPAAATPTQMSPVTAYAIDGTQVVYTQTFPPTPDPFPPPKAGTMGLGTLSGTVGAIKTANPAPTVDVRAMGAAVVGVGVGGFLAL